MQVETAERGGGASIVEPVRTFNAGGRSPFVILCDHASNRIPAEYGNLGLTPVERLRHIAWDPGALAVSQQLSEALDAPVVASTVSRLVVDCNRWHDAPDLIPALSESTVIPGNAGIDAAEKAQRIARYHTPFHAAIEALLDARAAEGMETILVAMHSFTPVYREVWRPWPIGVIHGVDTGFTTAFRDALAEAEPSLNIGWNEPYAALNGVTFTLEHHGDGRGLQSTMIEIRHDEILEPSGIARWAKLVGTALQTARMRHPAAGAPAGAGGAGA